MRKRERSLTLQRKAKQQTELIVQIGQVCEWMEEVLQTQLIVSYLEHIIEGQFGKAIHDGTAVCMLLNR